MKILEVMGDGDRFFIRVELHGAADDSEAYADLHEQMKEQNFIRTIMEAREKLELPSGMYCKHSRASVDKVQAEAAAIAKSVCVKHGLLKMPAVLTVKQAALAQSGLKKAK